ASIVGAPISGLILDHVHWLGLSSWRWLLILEGLPSILCGIGTYFLLPSRPADARFLASDEKKWLAAGLKRGGKGKLSGSHVSAAGVFTSGRVWHLALTGFTWDVGLYWMSFFMPQEIKSLSKEYSNFTVGLLVLVPQLVGLTGMILVARSSDRRLE